MDKTSLTIHRGTQEIGGSCVEIKLDKTRILFDLGLPLSSMTKQKPNSLYLLKITGLYKNDKKTKNQIKAIFITHAHPDHYGLLSEVSPKIPIYMTETTFNIITKISPLIKENNIKNLNFKIIKDKQEIILDKIKIQAFAVDHSAPEALAYKITIDNKTLVYCGDLRAKGFTFYKTKNFIKNVKDTDYLLLEGTSLGRAQKEEITEKDLTELFKKEFIKNELNLIYFSSQNLDRFISVYKAARKVKKILIIDPYTCAALEYFKSLGKNIPQYTWKNIRVYFAANKQTKQLGEKIFSYKNKKITLDEILVKPENFIVKANYNIVEKLFKKIKNINLIHSAWQGYLTKENIFVNLAKENNSKIKQIHTSGHADIKTLQNIVKEINPKTIIPIHTEFANRYKSIFPKTIKILKDGQNFIL